MRDRKCNKHKSALLIRNEFNPNLVELSPCDPRLRESEAFVPQLMVKCWVKQTAAHNEANSTLRACNCLASNFHT